MRTYSEPTNSIVLAAMKDYLKTNISTIQILTRVPSIENRRHIKKLRAENKWYVEMIGYVSKPVKHNVVVEFSEIPIRTDRPMRITDWISIEELNKFK